MSRVRLRARLILLGLLAVLAVSLVASAAATEPPAKCGGKAEKTPDYCVAGFELENAKGEPVAEKFEGTNSGASILKATVSMVKAEIKCEAGKSKGTIEDGAGGTVGKSKVTDTFETCKLVKPTNCKLTAADEKEIETAELKGELGLTAGRIEDKLESKTSAFATISIEGKENSCVIAEVGKPKSFAVTGSQLCEVDGSNTVAETEAATHKIVCKTSGSSLEVGGPAEMTSEATVKLTSGKNWSIKEDT